MSIKSNNENYFSRIGAVISKSLQSYNRISAIRIDLRFPSYTVRHLNDPKVITRFFESLKAKIQADLIRKSKSWERRCFSELYYIWVREFGEINNKKHYHILIMVNKDIYKGLGNYDADDINLGKLIQQAWCSAINVDYLTYKELVHFPTKPTYWLDKNAPDIKGQILQLKIRCLYLTKNHSKHYGDGERSFGCSR